MVDYLSAEWLERFGDLVGQHPVTASSVETAASLSIGFIVTTDESGDGASYRVTVDGAAFGVIVDDADTVTKAEADVVIVSTRTVAATIARGERSALDAFMTGDLLLDGETTRLVDARETLVDLVDVTGELRRSTRF